MRHLTLALTLSLSLPLATTAWAAGGGDETAPSKPKCKNGQVYDKKTKTCVDAQDSRLDTEDRYETVRRLAHAGRYAEAQQVLAQMPPRDDRTLTYLGFTARKMGERAAAFDHYAQALAVNPGNVLARSYLGQGLVEEGRIAEALDQLRLIRQHGGSGSWAETALQRAIATGRTYSY